jgi:hypothetical protein
MNRLLLGKKFGLPRYVLTVAVLWVLYAVLNVMAPASPAISRYGITITQGNLLRATVLLPLLVIWLAALFAVVRFRYYTGLLRGSSDATAFKYLAQGLIMLFLVIVLPSFVSLVASYSPASLAMQKASVIIRNYLNVILYLLAFWYMWQGSRNLNKTVEVPLKRYKRDQTAVIALLAVLVIIYIWAIFNNQFRTISNDPLVRPTYYLSDWLIILTVFIPYVIAWFWGSLAIVNIRTFAQQVPGIFYRKAFTWVARGLIVIVALSICLQFLSQSASVFSHATLKLILLIVYLLLLAIASGYLLLAKGARDLAVIEEI